MKTDLKPTQICAVCGLERKTRPNKDGGLKLPKGWRKLPEPTCKACAAKSYYTRGFRIEISGLAEEREFKEFRAALSAAAKASARFGNWLVQKLYAADLAAMPVLEKTKDGKTKLPPCPSVDYYRDAVAAFPELSGGCISGLGQMVRQWYSARRYEALVSLNRSVENYRFGFLPVEVRKQDWSLREQEGKLVIRAAVQPGKSWLVKIYADRFNFARLKQIQAGDAIPLGCKIVRATKQPIAGSNAPPRKAWFFRISAMFPRTVKRKSHQEVTLTLGHEANQLLFGALEDSDEVFEFPGLELRKMIVGGDRTERRWQGEISMRRGIWSKRKQARWSLDRTRRCENRQRKIAAQLKLIAAALTRWCKSHGVTSVDYEVKDMGFIPHFPWRKMRDDMHNALEREGIALNVVDTNQESSAALVGPGGDTDG